MTPATYLRTAIEPALSLLPPRMDTPEARAMVLAIALQESRLAYRRQTPAGPARGFAQFEMGGVSGVMRHEASRTHATALCDALSIPATPGAVYGALEFQDVLCAGFSRLLLWTLPGALPGREDAADGWAQYLEAWRPGKPHPETWPPLYVEAWAAVDERVKDRARERGFTQQAIDELRTGLRSMELALATIETGAR